MVWLYSCPSPKVLPYVRTFAMKRDHVCHHVIHDLARILWLILPTLNFTSLPFLHPMWLGWLSASSFFLWIIPFFFSFFFFFFCLFFSTQIIYLSDASICMRACQSNLYEFQILNVQGIGFASQLIETGCWIGEYSSFW